MANKEKKGKKSLFLIIFLVLFVGIGTFAGTYYFVSKNNIAAPVVVEEAFVEVGEIFVNLSDEGSNRYVKLNLSISYNKRNSELAKEIGEKAVVIRDTAIFYIKSCKAKDFEPANEVILKSDLISRINQKLSKGVLEDIYISEIIVQ